jgi:glucose/mannose-6-phosphate isomerase
MMDVREAQEKLDKKNMLGLVQAFPSQMADAWRIGEAFSKSLPKHSFQRVLLCGMGGSAIGGDMVRSCMGNRLRVPLIVTRDYEVPSYLPEGALCIISSYSGNTGETLAAFESIRDKAGSILAITSGGKLQTICEREGIPFCRIPGGMPPRAAIAYSFFPIAHALWRMGLADFDEEEYPEAMERLKRCCADYSIENPENQALELARKVCGRIPFIYAGGVLLEAVARRWSGQINENGKSLAHFAVFPELDHNEIVGWETPRELLKRIMIVSLEDREDHEMAKRQREICLDVIKPLSGEVIRIEAEGNGRLARILSTMILGDFMSVYLALLNGVDPTPVEKIDYLKARLKQAAG